MEKDPKDGEVISLDRLFLGDYADVIETIPELAPAVEIWKKAQSLRAKTPPEQDPGPPTREDPQNKLSKQDPNEQMKLHPRLAKRLEFLHERQTSHLLGPQGESRSRSIADWIRPIPIEKIMAETDFSNIRLDPTDGEIDLLAASMSDEGLKVPITVTKGQDDTYLLRAGSRRLTAARQLGWTFIPAIVLPWNTPQITERWTNIIENSARKPLRTYEIANAAHIMKQDFGVEPRDFAKKAGYNPVYIGQLVKAIENLPPMIIENWRTTGAMPIDWYFKWSNMRHEEAIRSFQLECGQRFQRRTEPMSPDTPRQSRKGKLHTATESGLRRMQRLRFAITAFPGIDEATRHAYLEIVDYCQGTRDTVLDIYDCNARHRKAGGHDGRRTKGPKTGTELDMEEEMRRMAAEICTGEEDGKPVVSDVLPIRTPPTVRPGQPPKKTKS